MSKCCLIFMPIVIMVQGIVYFGLSIWGLLMRECSSEIIDIANNPFGFVMDIIYFFDEMCGNPNVTVAGLSEPVTLIESNFLEPTINRTEAFLICYLVISALWIFFSLLNFSIVSYTSNRNAKILSYILWFAVVLSGCILDAVATGFHIYDVVHTTSADNTFSYLGISTNESVMAYIRGFDEYFVVPSLVMTCISSRIFFIWIFNIIGSCYCISVFNLEGCLYLGLSICGLVMRACSHVTTDILQKPFQFTTDLIYLQDQDCGNPNVTIFGVSAPVTLELNWTQAEPIKKRTFILLIHYTIYSSLWIISSLLMIYTAFKWPNKWILYLWFKIIWISSVIDVVAIGFYGYDIVHTSSAIKTFEYLGLTTNEATLKYLTSFDVQFTTPAIVMTVICSRGVILWLFNVIGSLYYLLIMRKIIAKKTLSKRIISITDVIPVTIVIQKEPASEVVHEALF